MRSARPHGSVLVAHLDGIEDRDAAAELAGTRIGLPRDALPALDDGQYYWVDLIGLEVLDEGGESLGVVRKMIETGANDVMVVGPGSDPGSDSDGPPAPGGPGRRNGSSPSSPARWSARWTSTRAGSGCPGRSTRTRREPGRERGGRPEREEGRPVNIAVVTLFPAMLDALRAGGVTARAEERGLFAMTAFNPRDFTGDRHRTVDDRPYGGGPGMVLMFEPMFRAVEAARARLGGSARTVLLSPQGARLDQAAVRRSPAKRRWCSSADATRAWTSGSSKRPSTRRSRSATSC